MGTVIMRHHLKLGLSFLLLGTVVNSQVNLDCDRCGTGQDPQPSEVSYITEEVGGQLEVETTCPESILTMTIRNQEGVEVLRSLTLSANDESKTSKWRYLRHYSSVQVDASRHYSPGAKLLLEWGKVRRDAALVTTPKTVPDKQDISECDNVCSGRQGSLPLPDQCCSQSFCSCPHSGPTTCPVGQAFCPSQGLCVSENRCSKSCCEGARKTDGGVKVEYSCLRRTTLASGEGHLDYSNAPKEIERSVVPHAKYAYHTHGTTLRQIEVNLDLPSPVSGFAAVGLGDGRFMITSKSLNLTIHNPNLDNSSWAQNSVQVLSLNTPMEDSSKVDIVHLLKRPEPPSTTTTTTTPKPIHPDQFLQVYVLIVNEKDFIDNKNEEKFRNVVWQIFTEACTDIGTEENLVELDIPTFCKKECDLTNDPDRGCVKMGVHLEGIPEVASCPAIQGSRVDYLRQKLEDRASDLASSYGAGRLTVDSCTAVTWKTEWVWVAVGLVLFGILMAGLILFCRGRFRRRTPGLLEDMDPVDDEPPMTMPRNKHFVYENEY